MWPSKYSWNWNAMDVGPKRDLVGKHLKVTSKAECTPLCYGLIFVTNLELYNLGRVLHL